MYRQQIESGGIRAVGYDPESRTLEVELPGGAVRDYAEVPEAVYESLLQAPDKEAFVRDNIAEQYQEVRAGEAARGD